MSLIPAAAAKSLQSCPTLCDPIDGSPPGSPVPGILQARTLEWVAISFSSACEWKVKVKLLSRFRLLVTPWTVATRLLHPWDFLGKSTGVGCHCLLRWYKLLITKTRTLPIDFFSCSSITVFHFCRSSFCCYYSFVFLSCLPLSFASSFLFPAYTLSVSYFLKNSRQFIYSLYLIIPLSEVLAGLYLLLLSLTHGALFPYAFSYIWLSCVHFPYRCLFAFWLRLVACRILVPLPEVEPGPWAVKKARSLTTRESPVFSSFICMTSLRPGMKVGSSRKDLHCFYQVPKAISRVSLN